MYSLLDATSKPNDIIERLQEIKQTSFAITDHGHCYNHAVLYKIFEKANIKMIIGCEVYICDDTKIHDKDNKYYHLILLCKDEQGRKNLYKLVTLSNQRENFYFKPRIDFSMLEKYHDGLICLSACMVGEIQQYLRKSDYNQAKKTATKYKSLFGDDYYLEIQAHSDNEQQSLNKSVVNLAKEIGIEYVVTCDSHYVRNEDQQYHDIFVQIGEQRETGETYNDCYIQSENEVRDHLKNCLTQNEINTAISNTDIISEKCNAKVPISAPIIPKISVPPEFKSDIDYVRYLCDCGWKKYGYDQLSSNEQSIYKQRMEYELNSIDKLGFASYFLMVLDYSSHAKVKGPGRGSAGGSLVSRLLGITQIDPIKYGLYFERFIDVSQLEELEKGKITKKDLKIPDIDLDFGKQSREDVRSYLESRYGTDRIASIGTFQYLVAKAAIKDIGRVIGIPFEITNRMTSKFDKESIDEVIESGMLDEYKNQYPQLFEYIQKLAGLPKSFSRHACAIIISENDLDSYCPVTLNKDAQSKEYIATLEVDEHGAEDLGLVKDDLLGLRTMDVIHNVLKMINKDESFVDVNKIDMNDDAVYKEFRDGNTLGLFQMESPGMTNTVRKIQPTCISDVSAVNALYRPGAMPYIDTFANRKNGIEKIEYLHPDLQNILSESYGVMVYQEQLIQVGRLAGIKNPDSLRKACGKKNMELLKSLEPDVKNGLKARGWTDIQVTTIWNDMIKFGSYAFNKSHAFIYGMISYITAYLKHYYPLEFMCAVLNSYAGNIKKIPLYLNEVKRLNLKVVPFSWKNTSPMCVIEDNMLKYGTGLIKGVNSIAGKELTEINKNHTFNNFIDLLVYITEKSSIGSKQLEILIHLGFFSDFGGNKKLLSIYRVFQDSKIQYKKTYCDKTKVKRIEQLKEFEKKVPDRSLSPKLQIEYENENLGAPESVFDLGKGIGYVMDINTKYSPILKLYGLSNGVVMDAKINTKYFDTNPVNKGDFIKITNYQCKSRCYKTEDGWRYDNTQKVFWLTGYEIMYY